MFDGADGRASLRIERLVQRGRTVDVHLENGEVLSVDEETVVRGGLLVGVRLSADDIARLSALERQSAAYRRALLFLSYRPRTIREVRVDLGRRGYAAEAEAVIARLVAEGYLDDRRFAQMWIEERKRSRPRSRAALLDELAVRGVPRDVALAALGDYTEADEFEAAVRLAAPYFRRARGDLRTRVQKTLAYLGRHGFSAETAYAAVRRLRDASDGVDEAADDGHFC
ncbi:MAG: RecX family transcriptional regulator [Hydrogenibacillus sp.]|nr:RecX family transcriptional regulator [Hydrogenibacillus sp.]